MQINRLFEIVYILLSKKTVTARELAEHFGVSARTIYRDVDTLSLAGIPVYTEKGANGVISLLPDFVLNKSILSEQEQNMILSALQGLSGIKTTETDNVLQKLSAIFNKSAVNWLEVDFTDWGYSNGGVFDDFKSAILERRIAEFDYYSTFCEKTHRLVEPIQLWFKSRAWYLKAFCLTRQDVRLFKLSRVRSLQIKDEQFGERDLLMVTPDPSSPDRNKPSVLLKLKIAPEMAYRVYDEFCENCVQKQADGSFIITADYPEGDWTYGVILSYGDYAEVLEPRHIREIIKQKAQNTAKKYP